MCDLAANLWHLGGECDLQRLLTDDEPFYQMLCIAAYNHLADLKIQQSQQ
jgi:hypothetical protein